MNQKLQHCLKTKNNKKTAAWVKVLEELNNENNKTLKLNAVL